VQRRELRATLVHLLRLFAGVRQRVGAHA
jgi:hypothetical protein